MLTYMTCVLVAVAWLWYRLFKFLDIPVFKIEELLNIELPQSTKVSVDRITHDTITLHWENEPDVIDMQHTMDVSHHKVRVLSYKLYLNGKLVANFPNTKRTYTCVSLRGLNASTQYQLDLVTVNQLGFTNKLPNLFVMTLSKEIHKSSSDLSLELSDFQDEQLHDEITLSVPTEAVWRKQLLITQGSKTTTPSYSSLATLKDLEDFSIQDLKNILICSQEDLHDVVQQHSLILQDFNDSKMQLQMELDNLKVQWNHEIELRKSLKSTIKSLESSKLLYDLKRQKFEKSIQQVTKKLTRMNTDMKKWTADKDVDQRKLNLENKYKNLISDLDEQIKLTSEQIKELQTSILEQDEDNRRLNQLKKGLEADSSQPLSISHSNSHESIQFDWAQFLKKINDCTISKSGLLNQSGEAVLKSLPDQSPFFQLVKSELDIDIKLESQWRHSKNKFVRRIEQLEQVWKDLQAKNTQLKNELTLQTYAIGQQLPQSSVSPNLHPQTALQRPKSLNLHDPASYTNPAGTGSLLAQTVASAPFGSWLQQGQQNQIHQNQRPDTSMSNANSFYNMEYDDSSNHILSGLETMVSEIGDNQRSRMPFTNDQLDGYWNMPSHSYHSYYDTNHQQQQQQQSIIRLSSIGSSQSSLSQGPQQFKSSDRNIMGVLNDNANDDVISFHSALNNVSSSSPMVIPSNNAHPAQDTSFSPTFHSIWNGNHVATPSTSRVRSESQQEPWVFDEPLEIQTSPTTDNKTKETPTRRMSKLFAKGTHLFKLPSQDSQ